MLFLFSDLPDPSVLKASTSDPVSFMDSHNFALISPQIQNPASNPLRQSFCGADTEEHSRRCLLGPGHPDLPPGTLIPQSGDAEGE